ncbi:MAG: Eco29kI family restriction endonuclease, partial [Planctomycetes bacterium]|nr:Eco29kI family restriction endonuclease [Planctomycetota bacterium]
MSAAVDLKKHTFASPKFKSVIQEAMRFMMRSPIHPLPPADRFPGAGVYALYYNGNFPAYAPIKGTETPIYVGKADPRSDMAKLP